MLDGAKNKWFHKNVRFQKNHLKANQKKPLTQGLNIVKIKSPVRGLLFFMCLLAALLILEYPPGALLS